ncbi:alpha/beta fold hydrolase [Streptomyces inhibens]|uniref:alpha/beta fold hydrolase n=1 Tax=Streptomyces inhibens TaxID=2293571 RepID=UPI0015F27A79
MKIILLELLTERSWRPVLLLAGAYDVGLLPWNSAEYADFFGHAKLAVQPGAGHCPWLDDPAWFTRTWAAFLG